MAATGDGHYLLACETVATTASGYNDPDAWERVVRESTPQSVPDSIRTKTLQLQPFRIVAEANITNSRLPCCAIVTCEAGRQGPHSLHVIHQLNQLILHFALSFSQFTAPPLSASRPPPALRVTTTQEMSPNGDAEPPHALFPWR